MWRIEEREREKLFRKSTERLAEYQPESIQRAYAADREQVLSLIAAEETFLFALIDDYFSEKKDKEICFNLACSVYLLECLRETPALADKNSGDNAHKG